MGGGKSATPGYRTQARVARQGSRPGSTSRDHIFEVPSRMGRKHLRQLDQFSEFSFYSKPILVTLVQPWAQASQAPRREVQEEGSVPAQMAAISPFLESWSFKIAFTRGHCKERRGRGPGQGMAPHRLWAGLTGLSKQKKRARRQQKEAAGASRTNKVERRLVTLPMAKSHAPRCVCDNTP